MLYKSYEQKSASTNVEVLKYHGIFYAAYPKTIEYTLHDSKNVLTVITVNLGRINMSTMAGSLPSTFLKE